MNRHGDCTTLDVRLQWRLRRRHGHMRSHCLRLDLIIVIPVGMKAVPGGDGAART